MGEKRTVIYNGEKFEIERSRNFDNQNTWSPWHTHPNGSQHHCGLPGGSLKFEDAVKRAAEHAAVFAETGNCDGLVIVRTPHGTETHVGKIYSGNIGAGHDTRCGVYIKADTRVMRVPGKNIGRGQYPYPVTCKKCAK